MTYFSGLLPTIILLCGLGIGAGAVSLWWYAERRAGKRPPFTKNFLRSPGESLRRELDDLLSDVSIYLTPSVAKKLTKKMIMPLYRVAPDNATTRFAPLRWHS